MGSSLLYFQKLKENNMNDIFKKCCGTCKYKAGYCIVNCKQCVGYTKWEASEEFKKKIEDYNKRIIAKAKINAYISKPEIKKVIFNDPATIVFWSDNTKTVVKACNGDIFDPEKGLAMAISKKMLGNQDGYYSDFKKWLPEEKDFNINIKDFYKEFEAACRRISGFRFTI